MIELKGEKLLKKLNKFYVNIVKIIFIVFTIQLVSQEKAYAYLDPGTGSMVIQLIVAFIASISCTITLWKDKIIQVFQKRDSEDE